MTVAPDPALAGAPVQLHASVTTGSGRRSARARSPSRTARRRSAPPLPVDASGQQASRSRTSPSAPTRSPRPTAARRPSTRAAPPRPRGSTTTPCRPARDQTVLRGGTAELRRHPLPRRRLRDERACRRASRCSVSLLPPDASSNAPATVSVPAVGGLADEPDRGGADRRPDPRQRLAAVPGGREVGERGAARLRLRARRSRPPRRRCSAARRRASRSPRRSRSAPARSECPPRSASPPPRAPRPGRSPCPGSTAATVPTGRLDAAGAQTVSVTGDPGPRLASATLVRQRAAGGERRRAVHRRTRARTLTLHGTATDTAGGR